CNNPCNDGEVCSSGTCDVSCQAGLTECSGMCVDTDYDPDNCGMCDNVCEEGLCSEGQCISLPYDLLDVATQSSIYTSMARGYYFQAPVDLYILGLRVPPEAGTEDQNIHLIKFNSGPPPTFSSTTSDFTTLAYSSTIPGDEWFTVGVYIEAGTWVGVLGTRGSSDANSYGPTPYTTSFGSYSVTITRLLYQGSIDGGPATEVSNEPSGNIGRVEMKYLVLN
ncbi:MAG: hypothetical protein JXR95_14170, partial [Deltaproteobacteria bacterium]|nr:hypothetical protein [Deltaproteobacteria bacterium]